MENKKIKVLTVNCTYEKGSTGKIIKDTANELSDKCDFVFCYETGPKAVENSYRIAGKYEFYFYYLLARLLGLKYSTGFTSTFRLLRFIKKQKPDVVHLHCPNINTVNIPWLISHLKKYKIPTVVTNHAEFYYTGNCPHAYECLKFQTGCGNCDYVFDPYRKYLFDRTAYEWKRMKKAFSGGENIIMTAVSPWVESRIKLSPIANHLKTSVVKNAVDTDVFCYKSSDLKHKLGIPDDKKVLVYVTARFTDDENDLKGGKYLIELATRLPDIQLVIAGSVNLAKPEELPENIKTVGQITDQKLLAEYYSMADLSVITSRRETYGMAVAESLCCGTPVVGFKAGGPESVALPQYSEFVEHGDVTALRDAVEKLINFKTEEKAYEISNDALKEYSAQSMAQGYFEVYSQLSKAK